MKSSPIKMGTVVTLRSCPTIRPDWVGAIGIITDVGERSYQAKILLPESLRTTYGLYIVEILACYEMDIIPENEATLYRLRMGAGFPR